jgi:hypothetical protein
MQHAVEGEKEESNSPLSDPDHAEIFQFKVIGAIWSDAGCGSLKFAMLLAPRLTQQSPPGVPASHCSLSEAPVSAMAPELLDSR